MKKLVLICGPAGIGKSTFCKKYMAAHPDETCFVVAADEVRKDMCGDYDKFPPNHNMMLVYNRMVELMKQAAEENEHLTMLVDTTMLFDERRMFFVNSLPEYEWKELILLKLHDYEIAVQRNGRRIGSKKVPEDVVRDMCKHYDDPSPETLSHFQKFEEVFLDE
ncbi:MAG: ATP-binding protein [Bacilli bacterium]|nr:ATP-binding protein [Bacilli bacterium]